MQPTIKQITEALQLCVKDTPGTADCERCYLWRYRDKDGMMSTGETCYTHLALDAVEAMNQLNDFQNSQCAKLLGTVAELREQLPVCCRDCKYTSVSKDGIRWCRLSGGLDGDRKDMDFCSYGVQKEITT